ncbi:TBC1 domain family member 23 isoform X2 [Bacillus rossius redtenbacheri]|uniref:TBC1 domain family member 23 isoform X2 n=1 Tax=Bacillus rossius redtenbacheri TaxID=93214 RepID=UPI002FDDE008
MAIDGDDNTWTVDLETALLEDCSAAAIYNICKGRSVPEAVRAEVWQACLDVQNKGNQMLLFNDIFDLPEQSVLRDDCNQFVANLGNDEEDKVSVVSDLESVLTHYCKSSSARYERGNGWVEILLPLIALKLPRWHTYNLFQAIKHRYVPRSCKKNGPVFHLFRLLLLYHDPELCSFLDTMRITPDLYCRPWFQSLFAATCSLPAVLCMWDLYFQQADPFFVFFLALVMIFNAREQIFSMKGEPKQVLVDTLAAMPCALEADDVTDFCSLAQYYALKTPCSFKENLCDVLFCHGDSLEQEAESRSLSQALCLPVSAHELVENTAGAELVPDSLRFFLVDCRPAEQYNAGHLPTAFHLDCNLMLQEPAAFLTAVQGLLSAQRQALAARSAAGGEHLCFLGSGRLEEDQYTHMVVASFLQKHTHFVSMLSGGYMAIHEYLDKDVGISLEDHSPQRCVVCVADAASEDSESSKPNHTGSSDIFGKLSAAVKLKSAEVKGKLFDYIVNPTGSGNAERHVSSSDKLGKRYRNLAPVFSIDDDQEGGRTNTNRNQSWQVS